MSSRPANEASDSEANDRLTELSEYAGLVLGQAALDGLADMAEGRLAEGGELGEVLAVVPPQPRLMG